MKKKTKLIIAGTALVAFLFLFRNKIEMAVWDLISQKRINTLHPAIQQKAQAFVNEAERQGIKLRVTSAYRSFEEQNDLYKQGRSKPGQVVTNAQGGESTHNYGFGFDVVEMVNGKPVWNNPNWNRIGEIGKSFGFEWGGDWKSFKDKPHFQNTFGYSIADLQQKVINNEVINGFVLV